MTDQSSPPFSSRGALWTGVFAVSWGAIFVRFAQDGAPLLVIAAYRVGLAVILLLPLGLWSSWSEIKSLGRKTLGISVLSGLFLAFHFATWISSLGYTSVASSVVIVNTNPVWVAILAPFLGHDKTNSQTVWGIALSLLGCVIIGAGDLTLSSHQLWGDVLALMGAWGAALYILLGRKLRAQVSFMAYVLLCYGTAALALWSFLLIQGLPFTGFSPSIYGWFLLMALIPQIIGHGCYNYALKWVTPQLVAVSLLGEPIISSLLAFVLLGEGIGVATWIGGVAILVGIYLTAGAEKKEEELALPE